MFDLSVNSFILLSEETIFTNLRPFFAVNKFQLPARSKKKEKQAFYVKAEVSPALEPKAVGGCGCVGVT